MLLMFLSLLSVIDGVPLAKMHDSELVNMSVELPIVKVHDSGLMNDILSSKNDHKALLSIISEADPAKLDAVVALVRALLETSKSELEGLNTNSDNADVAYNNAVTAHETAVGAQTTGLIVLKTAYDQGVAALQAVVDDAKGVKDTASATKNTANGVLAAEKSRLENEIRTLTDIIALIEGLKTPNAVTGEKLSFHLPGSTASAYARVLDYEFPGTSDFSVEGWIKLPVVNQNQEHFMFSFNTVGNDNCILLYSPKNLKITWTHLAMNIDSNRAIKTFINGSPHNLVYGSTFCGNTIGSLVIGQDQDTVGGGMDANQAPEILFDSLRVYQGILSDAEILQLASQQKCIVREPWSNWAFADSLDVGKDYSIKKQDFQIVGGDIVDGVTDCIA